MVETVSRLREDQLDERALTVPLVMFEMYQGEVFKTGPADFDVVDEALSWVTVVDETVGLARAAGELQNDLHDGGSPLAARDAFIAGAAKGLNEPLAVSDSDFDIQGLTETIAVDFV